jgi:hypothetical protein
MYRLLLLLAVVVTAACSDTQQPTAPSKGRTPAPNGSAAGQLAPSPQAKPTDQVGFTKITHVITNPQTLPAGSVSELTAQCPSGSVLTGGGYSTSVFPNLSNDARPFIADSRDGGANGWYVRVFNTATGATEILFWAYAYCAS